MTTRIEAERSELKLRPYVFVALLRVPTHVHLLSWPTEELE